MDLLPRILSKSQPKGKTMGTTVTQCRWRCFGLDKNVGDASTIRLAELPKINARVIRGQVGVGGIAMKLGNRHRISAILLSFKLSTWR